jgi:uracil-DNA glycosylase family 4
MSNISGLDDLLDSSVAEPTFVPDKPILNQQPSIQTPYRIAIIGEAPGKDEVQVGKPFVGMSGKLLDGLLGKAKILRDGCFIGNVCQIRPPNNDIKFFRREGPEIKGGLSQLDHDIKIFNPNICVLLGKTALWAAKGTDKIFDWRGSFFVGELSGPFFGRKCIASVHPAYCLRDYTGTPLLRFDLIKAKQEAESPVLVLPQRELTTNLTCYEITSRLENIRANKHTISIDIEGGVNSMSCISVAVSPTDSFIIPFTTLAGSSYWHLDDECSIFKTLSEVLADASVPKILQNSLYDRFVLQYSYDIIVRNTVDDTLLKSWEKYCELEKNLGFLCSIYTREPFYKSDRKTDSQVKFYEYCCRDSAVTYEISNVLNPMLNEQQQKHYRLYVELLNAFLYIELKGFPYDHKEAKRRRQDVLNHIYTLQADMDKLAGVGIKHGDSCEEILRLARSEMCYVRNQTQPKKEYEEEYPEVQRILTEKKELSQRDIGFLNTACGWSMNVKSKALKTWFYDVLKLPPQYKTDPKTKKKSLTTDFDATLKLMKLTNHPAVQLLMTIQLHRTRAQMLAIVPSDDGRMRESLNIVGSETGRVTSSRSSDRSKGKRVGTNMQTVSDDWDISEEGLDLIAEGLRTLYGADEGKHIFQCDLKGSDGWTIGAHMAALGDPTMLDDLRFGLKPAQIVAYILRHGNELIRRSSRAEIKELVKEIKKEDWEYFVSKQGIWGTSYTMGPDKLAECVLKESWGKIQLSRNDAKKFQAAIMTRYNVRLWHNHCQRLIDQNPFMKVPQLISAVGHTRHFFGRRQEILGKWLAHEPQIITTYATNLAAWKLWNDTENRITTSSSSTLSKRSSPLESDRESNKVLLRIEPLHQVHDALIGQFKIEDTAWAVGKIRSYFANQIMIAGISITIPFEGNYGPSWGKLDVGTI